MMIRSANQIRHRTICLLFGSFLLPVSLAMIFKVGAHIFDPLPASPFEALFPTLSVLLFPIGLASILLLPFSVLYDLISRKRNVG